MAEVADSAYIQSMDQESGVYGAEDFVHPAMKNMTANAKDVVSQIMTQYNNGDVDIRQAVNNFELDRNRSLFTNDAAGQQLLRDSISKDKLLKDTAWELFYQAHQKYIGTKLQNENNPPTKDEEEVLRSRYGFDMQGVKLFNFESLIRAGKLKPKGID